MDASGVARAVDFRCDVRGCGYAGLVVSTCRLGRAWGGRNCHPLQPVRNALYEPCCLGAVGDRAGPNQQCGDHPAETRHSQLPALFPEIGSGTPNAQFPPQDTLRTVAGKAEALCAVPATS